MTIALIVIIILIVVVGLLFFTQYNKLIKLRVGAEEAFGQIEVQLQRRSDLIPNLVSTVKGYATHEKTTFEEVTKARAAATSAKTFDEVAAADQQVSKALVNVLAVAEQYPELKASNNFIALQEELTTTENKIAFSRQYYNDAVMRLNQGVSTIPGIWFAGMAKVSKRSFYEVQDPAARNVPKVEF